MKIKKIKLLAFIVLFALVAGVYYFSPYIGVPSDIGATSGEQAHSDEKVASYKAEVISIVELGTAQKQIAVKILDGNKKGDELSIFEEGLFGHGTRDFEHGDRVIILKDPGSDAFYIYDYVRSPALIWLCVLFVLAVLLISGMGGLGALIGMVFSFFVLFKLTLPLILSGTAPVQAAILGGLFIIPVTFFLSHGLNAKTITAMVGTLITLLFVYLLAWFFIDFANLTGLASEEISFLSAGATEKINFKGLVLAGMIIGIIGVLDDITISQAAVVQQLKETKKNISFKELYFRSMTVGKDHISSMVNTLILIYAGAALPLLLLFLDFNSSFTEIINIEIIAEEVIRTLIGSLGLVLAVPITTALAAMNVSKMFSFSRIK